MSGKNRRKFLRDLGVTVGALAIGRDITFGLPFQQKKIRTSPRPDLPPSATTIDFKYSPATWQSTYCFPDDPHKSLVGKFGELLYGHKGVGAPYNEFAHTVSFGIKNQESGTFVHQSLEAPGVPVITTKLDWKDCHAELVSFASNLPQEGRVDNLIIKISASGKAPVTLTPQILVTSQAKFSDDNRGDGKAPRKEFGIVTLQGEKERLFIVTDSPIDHLKKEGIHQFNLQEVTLSEGVPVQFVARFPQSGQSYDMIKDNLTLIDTVLTDTRIFWQTWKPVSENITWNYSGPYNDFLIASARNMSQSRETKEGKGPLQVGPTVYCGTWAVDGHFLAEAARYIGKDKEAQDTLSAIWDLQNEKGLIVSAAGSSHWKDTAAAVFALVRQAELSQNWDYFNELYPDAYKGLMALKDMSGQAFNDGSAIGKYGLLPKGFGDSGISGIRDEFTNTLWTMMALQSILQVSDRFFLDKRSEIRTYYGQLRTAFLAAAKQELRKHPNRFSYLPMLMKSDPQWQETDPLKQPKPQAAQIYLSQAFFPGLLFKKDDNLVKGHIEFMKSITREDVPVETGWLSNNGVWTYNAAITAQMYMWAGLPDLARQTFIGFLNHASPLYAWREEQPLLGSALKEYVGDMPHNWASAECIRFLRHILILEDEKTLRLFEGLGEPDLIPGTPLSIASSPTRWGRVTLSLEKLDAKAWVSKFQRTDFDEKKMPPLTSIEMPTRLPGNFQMDKVTGTTVIKNGPRATIDGTATSWEIVWRNFRRT